MEEVNTNLLLKNIEIVCRLNQARSPFLAAFLKSQFPEFVFTSSGIETEVGVLQSESISLIAKSWGFPYILVESRQLQVLPETYYFPVDDGIEDSLQDGVPRTQVISQKSFDYSHYVRKPSDPINLDFVDLARELALLISHSVFSLRGIVPISSQNPLLLYRIESFLTARQEMEKLVDQNPLSDYFIVNLCFRSQLVDSSFRESLSPDELLSTSGDSDVFSSKFEKIEPERFYCSSNLRNWLRDRSFEKPIILVVPPLIDTTGGLSVDSILGGIWATSLLPGLGLH